jgi:LmbE family N-acetylglucosaminyl deacetylase
VTVTGSVVFLHAHPDDEAIFTGGTMARLAGAGRRTVLVIATGGEQGALPAGLHPELPLGELRRHETLRAAEILGVGRVEFLGYRDSGLLAGTEGDTFSSAPSDEVAARIAGVLSEEEAVALVTYDEDGIYGHPDHVMVHACGLKAAEIAGVRTIYQATVDREYLHFVETHLVEHAKQARGDLGLAAAHLGVSSVEVTTTVDVRAVLAVKRAAMAAHASQIAETSFFLAMPEEMFREGFGVEWFILRGAPPGTHEHDLLDG